MRVLRSRVIKEDPAEVKSSKKRKSVARKMTQNISINDEKFAADNSVLEKNLLTAANEDREETLVDSIKVNRIKKDRKQLSKNVKRLTEVKNTSDAAEVTGRRTRNSANCNDNANTSKNEEKSKKEENILENRVIDTFKQFEKKINRSINFHETKKLSFDKEQDLKEDQIVENIKNGKESGSSGSSAYNTPSERNRKKWLKFDRDSVDAMQLLGEISKLNDSRRKSSRPSSQKKEKNVLNETFQVNNVPKVEKPKKIADSVKLSRTKLPNFALIHKKAYEKMESLVDYSERKKKRFMEISRAKESKAVGRMKFEEMSKPLGDKVSRLRTSLGSTPKELTSVRTPAPSRTLLPRTYNFTNNAAQNKSLRLQKENTFTINKKSGIPVAAFTTGGAGQVVAARANGAGQAAAFKRPVFSRPEALALANKQRVQDSTAEKKRQLIKNVRTNKRFDLLMSMRNRKA